MCVIYLQWYRLKDKRHKKWFFSKVTRLKIYKRNIILNVQSDSRNIMENMCLLLMKYFVHFSQDPIYPSSEPRSLVLENLQAEFIRPFCLLHVTYQLWTMYTERTSFWHKNDSPKFQDGDWAPFWIFFKENTLYIFTFLDST